MVKKTNIVKRKSDDEIRNEDEENIPLLQRILLPRSFLARFIVAMIFLGFARYVFTSIKPPVFAPANYMFLLKNHSVPCSGDYEHEVKLFPECAPRKCGRVIMDQVIKKDEANQMRSILFRGMSLTEASGGASILDLHSGAVSKGNQFVDIYSLMDKYKPVFTEEDFKLYSKVRQKIQVAIADYFNIDANRLFLTNPTFFSKITLKAAKTMHDEYWHSHIDKEVYGSFHYTSLLYLSEYDVDFQGGRFIFEDESQNFTIEPRFGRLSFFTSGSENPHHVEKVIGGRRLAITISFTCDPSKAIADPVLHQVKSL